MHSKKAHDSGWPDHVHADVSLGGYFQRMGIVERILIDKAGLLKAEASAALISSDPATKEKGAKWLRSELQQLRDYQKNGAHPTRRGTTLSLLEISDVAFTMLEAINGVDDELLSLLQELLNLDRHRRSMTVNLETFQRAANREAQTVLQGADYGVRQLAREMSVSVSTASQWKHSPEYENEVAFYKQAWTDRVGDYAAMIEAKFSGITKGHAFRIAMLADELLGPVGAQLRDERMRRDPDVLWAVGKVFEQIRSSFKVPPIKIEFLPKGDFSILTPEETRRQEAIVMEELTKIIGDPNGKVGRLRRKKSSS